MLFLYCLQPEALIMTNGSTSFFGNNDQVISYHFWSNKESFPFPINADSAVKALVIFYHIVNLALGGFLRSKIMLYLKSVSLKDNLINILIWNDQGIVL